LHRFYLFLINFSFKFNFFFLQDCEFHFEQFDSFKQVLRRGGIVILDSISIGVVLILVVMLIGIIMFILEHMCEFLCALRV
jgi:hypothetical protein